MLLILLFGVITLACFVPTVVLQHQRRVKHGIYSTWGLGTAFATWGTVLAGTIFFVLLIWFAAGNLTGAGEVTRLQAFYEDTISTYQFTIDRTEDVVIIAREELEGVITDFTYNGQGRAVSDRIAELRDRISEYNENLRYMSLANAWPLLGDFYYDLPEELKPIKLGT